MKLKFKKQQYQTNAVESVADWRYRLPRRLSRASKYSSWTATVKQGVDYMGEIVFDSTRPDGMLRKLMDVTRLNNLSWRATTALKTGLVETYQDFVGRHA